MPTNSQLDEDFVDSLNETQAEAIMKVAVKQYRKTKRRLFTKRAWKRIKDKTQYKGLV